MHNMLQLCGLTIDELADLYAREKSVKRVAAKLGMSRPTVTKWLKKANVKTLGHRPPIGPTVSMAGEYGQVATWIRENPGVKIPRSSDKAAALIGCSVSAVRNYFYRRSKRVMKYIASFGDLRTLPLTLEDQSGRRIRTMFASTYTIKLRNRGYKVLVVMRIRDTDFTCTYVLKDFLTLLRSTATV